MTFWNYYENGKTERHTLSDLEDYLKITMDCKSRRIKVLTLSPG